MFQSLPGVVGRCLWGSRDEDVYAATPFPKGSVDSLTASKISQHHGPCSGDFWGHSVGCFFEAKLLCILQVAPLTGPQAWVSCGPPHSLDWQQRAQTAGCWDSPGFTFPLAVGLQSQLPVSLLLLFLSLPMLILWLARFPF